MTMPKTCAGPSRLIGVLVPDIAFAKFGPILAGITESLQADGYSILVGYIRGDANKQIALVTGLIAKGIDGLILATASRDDPLVTFCLTRRIPTVLVDRADAKTRVSAVVPDDAAGIQAAVNHLVLLGHHNIGHLAGPQQHSTGFLRRQAFVQAMVQRGFAVKQAPCMIARNCTRAQGSEAARRLLSFHPEITAIVAASDMLAIGLYDVLQERDLNCPQDISVIGYDDMPLVDLMHPALTTIRVNHRDMGSQAADLLKRVIEGAKVEQTIVLAPELVLRSSTAKLRSERYLSISQAN
jgi:LacI family transcriptional regulator